MKVVIAGGRGLVGRALAESLVSRADVVILSRSEASVPAGRVVKWDPSAAGAWGDEVADADAVINLAGSGIADKRWSEGRKRDLWDSRIVSTKAIVDALGVRARPGKPVLISASAIGYYGSRGDELLDEKSEPGHGFLSDLSLAWEKESQRASPNARVVNLRIGIVLSLEGGALGAMLPLFRLGLGGPLGDGRQWMSWIHIADLVAMIAAVIDDSRWEGPVNAVAPNPVRNREFTKLLGRALGRPAFLPAPGLALRIVVGEMAGPLLLEGQRLAPARAKGWGFSFRHETLESAMEALFGS